MEKRIDLKAYAKINLSLDVTGRREDGYHEVAMVMQAIGLYDDISVRLQSADGTADIVDASGFADTVGTSGSAGTVGTSGAADIVGASGSADTVGTSGFAGTVGAVEAADVSDVVGTANTVRADRDANTSEPQIVLHFKAGSEWNGSLDEIPTDSRNTAYKAAEIMLEEAGRISESAASAASSEDVEKGEISEDSVKVEGAEKAENSEDSVKAEGAEKAESVEGAEETKRTEKIEIEVVKNIPAAAGLAGGSADAAGVIMALNKLLELNLSLTRLCELAVHVGADVPFCVMTVAAMYRKELGVSGGTVCALAEGIGEILTPLRSVKFDVLLAKPPVSVSTKMIYAMLDSTQITRRPNNAKLIKGLETGSFSLIKESMFNVLEPVTFGVAPKSEVLKEQMEGRGSFAAMMSGSGPTVYALYTDRNKAIAAKNALHKLRDENYLVILTETL